MRRPGTCNSGSERWDSGIHFAKLCFPRKQIQGSMLQDFCQRKMIQGQMLQDCAAKGSGFLAHQIWNKQIFKIILTNPLAGQKRKLRPRDREARCPRSDRELLVSSNHNAGFTAPPACCLSLYSSTYHLCFLSRSPAHPLLTLSWRAPEVKAWGSSVSLNAHLPDERGQSQQEAGAPERKEQPDDVA